MTTRSELIADLDVWLARDDLSSGGAQDTLLRVGQAHINRRVRMQAQEVIAQLACSSRSTTFPTGFQALRSLTLDNALGRDLTYLTPERLREAPIWLNQGGSRVDNSVVAYTIEALGVTLAPEPTVSAPVTLDIVYFKKFDDLEDPSDTNTLLTEHYDIYLWSLLRAAGIFLEDEALEMKYSNLFDRDLADLERSERRNRIPIASGLIATGNPRAVV